MPRMVANAALRYASKDMAAGEEFEASGKDAFILNATGKAHAVEAPATVERKDETPPPDDASRSTPRARYKRRDMRAQG